MPLQQIRNKIKKLYFSDFFGKNVECAGSIMLLIFFLSFLTLTPVAHASQTNGTISSIYKYAWSSVGGYVNFAPTKSTVSVTNTGISGYAWSANDGWINLSPSGSGVTNNASGVLGGFAWNSLKGWISFTGITIDSSGRFHGKAVGTNETISFDCTHCDVRTDWRPISVPVTVNSTTNNSGSISPVIGGSNAPNPLPGVYVSPAKTKQSTIEKPRSSLNSISTSHNTGLSRIVQTHVTSTTSSTGKTANTQSTTTPLSPLRTVAYISGGAFLLFILFFVMRFFI